MLGLVTATADVEVRAPLTADSLRLIAPASFIPGKPFLVRVDLLNAEGQIDRSAWNTTVALSSNVAGVTFPDVTLYNGIGSALVIAGAGGDPGNLNLIATGGGFSAQKALTSLGVSPAMTNVTGALPAGVTTWSGVIHVTGDVTVPSGATLNIAAGTHVLFDGNSTAGSTTGKRLIVNGTLNSQGTLDLPVAISAFNPADHWGQISFNAAQPSTLSFTLLNHAGHTTGVGHTGRGPMLRVTGSTLTITDSAIADGPAKAIYTSGTCNLTIQRSLIERMVTGPEIEDGCAFLCEDSNIQRILPDYRESNANVPDDEDCMYVHNGTGRSVIMRRSVFSRCGDDVFDCLGGPITIEDSILREGWDKGVSLLNNTLTITRSLIIDCDKGIAFKNSSLGATRNTSVTQCTIVSEEHDTNTAPWGYPIAPSAGDPDAPATALWTQWKSAGGGGTPTQDGTMNMTVSNCILVAKLPIQVDNGPGQYTNATTSATYTCTFDTDDPGNAAWPGTGNINSDPLFVSAAAKDFQLQAASPCRDRGDPAAPVDPDGTRADIGALPFNSAIVPTEFSAWMTYHSVPSASSDGDRDGLVALLEYALGTNPNRSAGHDGAAVLPRVTLGANGRLEMQFDVRENASAAQGHGLPDIIYTIEASNDLSAWTTMATKNFADPWSGLANVIVGNANNGFVPVNVHDVAGNSRRFLRLRVTLSP